MYYRRKILLSLLEVFDNELEKIRLQKLLLLFTQKQEKPAYDFVPYKFGCFSFHANADLHTMTKYEQVSKQKKKWVRTEKKSWLNELKSEDRQVLFEIKKDYGNKSVQELLEITYKNYPYYALNSTIIDDVLEEEEQQNVKALRENAPEQPCLFTIGYEGISLEAYLNKLIKNGVNALLDVRKNAMSMKYGFNKSQLKNACEGVGITYLHFSEVGIKSSKRKELNSQDDYDRLFEDYKQSVLPKTADTQKEIANAIETYKRVALTCFEADSCQCHRRPLAEFINQHQELKLELIHL
ncbi:MAG: DUF488 domain-containing protein [Balneolaceae bacterium]|nr:DUF488 domain-containing protein [Balneolaceae bacterium]